MRISWGYSGDTYTQPYRSIYLVYDLGVSENREERHTAKIALSNYVNRYPIQTDGYDSLQ